MKKLNIEDILTGFWILSLKNVTKDITGAISDTPNRIYRLDNSMYQY